MVDEIGDMEFSSADNANIPVDIWLEQENEGPYKGKWSLSAANYMPRKAAVGDEAYKAIADTREELVALIKEHIVPLYERAMSHLQSMINGSGKSLYYWDERKGVNNGCDTKICD